MRNYHGYSMDFEWDRAYFMPFLEFYCFSCGWVPIALAFVLLYLLFTHSPMYSKEFRNAIAAYHINMIFNDIHHMYLFNPYPLFPMPLFVCNGQLCRWDAPTVLLITITGLIASLGSVLISIIAFMRMRNILSFESPFRFSVRQSCALIGFTAVIFLMATPGFALFAGNDDRKMEILNRTEFTWLQQKPDVLVWGDMFDTPAYDIEAYYLAFCGIYGTTWFASILIYTLIALRREKKKLLNITTRKKVKDQGNRMLLIQLCGSTISFIIPMMLMARTVKLGFPTSNQHLHSLIRVTFMFLFVNHSMICITLHLIMNRLYQHYITIDLMPH